jgi:ribosomal-protein-alanine N-acetyltransferase
MSATLFSERLALTPLAVADVDVAIEMFTNPAVTRFICDAMSEADIRRDMPVWTKRGGDGCIGNWCVSDRATGEKYGSGFLLPMPTDKDDTNWDHVVPGAMPDEDVEIGYILKEGAWGQGYATEVCRRLLRFAFEETPLEEIVATLDDTHDASKRVLEKSGLSCRGRRRAYGKDCPDWRITRSEWVAFTARPSGPL